MVRVLCATNSYNHIDRGLLYNKTLTIASLHCPFDNSSNNVQCHIRWQFCCQLSAWAETLVPPDRNRKYIWVSAIDMFNSTIRINSGCPENIIIPYAIAYVSPTSKSITIRIASQLSQRTQPSKFRLSQQKCQLLFNFCFGFDAPTHQPEPERLLCNRLRFPWAHRVNENNVHFTSLNDVVRSRPQFSWGNKKNKYIFWWILHGSGAVSLNQVDVNSRTATKSDLFNQNHCSNTTMRVVCVSATVVLSYAPSKVCYW